MFIRILTLLILVSGSILSFGQKVLISGYVKDTVKSRRYDILVIRNDTLRKIKYTSIQRLPHLTEEQNKKRVEEFLNTPLKGFEVYSKTFNDTNEVAKVKNDNFFRLWAYPTDTLFFQAGRHITQKYAVTDLQKMPKIDIKLLPEKCVPYNPCLSPVSQTFVFIGEKISLRGFDPYYCEFVLSLDRRYKAKYRVIKQLFGTLKTDTVEFNVSDHYGIPAFSNFRYALLFLGKYCEELYHEKYQFFEVYPTANGRWARPGDPYAYDGNLEKIVKPVPLKFSDDLSFDISNLWQHEISRKYPEPYFELKSKRAIPKLGAYVEDLIEIKKVGVLKSRGIILSDK